MSDDGKVVSCTLWSISALLSVLSDTLSYLTLTMELMIAT
jgi:hypothetical protein